MDREEGVSPVIATILMVAITIVLAATLYVMIGTNVLGGGSTSTLRLTATLTEDPRTSFKYSLNFTISMSIPKSTDKSNVKITIVKGDNVTLLTYVASRDVWSNSTKYGKWHFEAKLTDLDGDGKFGDHDVLWVYVVDDVASDTIKPPPFVSGDKVYISVVGYQGVSMGGEIQL